MEKKFNRDDIANANNIEELPLIDDLECSIDLMISLNSVMCKKCETIFCQECVKNWKEKSNDCPMRCTPFEYVNIENTFLKTQINKIRLFCCNKNNGCPQTPLHYEKEKHEKECEFNPISCVKCKKWISKKNVFEHYLKECEKLKIKCYICEQNYSLSNYMGHVRDCILKYRRCENCFKRLLIKENDKTHPECEMKIDECKICKVPEFTQIINNFHKHEEGINILQMKTVHLSNFHKLISQFEQQYKKTSLQIDKEKNILMKGAVDFYKWIFENQQDSIRQIEKKLFDFRKIEEENLIKIKTEKYLENIEIEHHIEELKNKIKDADDDINKLKWIIETEKDLNSSDNKLNINRRIANVNNLTQIFSFLEELGKDRIINQDDDDQLYFSRNTEIDKIEKEQMIKITGKCHKCFGITEVNNCCLCKNIFCVNCSGKCTSKIDEHSNKKFCADCIIQCELCGQKKHCTSCVKKCFYKECNNLFCVGCHEKNKHQIRPENTSCKFYKCESCETDSNCIMTTVFCNACNTRYCRKCLHEDHMKHINFS